RPRAARPPTPPRPAAGAPHRYTAGRPAPRGAGHKAHCYAACGRGRPRRRSRRSSITSARYRHCEERSDEAISLHHGPRTMTGVLLGLVLMLVAGKLGGGAAERVRQPPVLGELLAGVVLRNLALL